MIFSFAFSSINALYPLMSMGYFGAGTTGAGIVEVLFAGGMMLGGIALGITGGFKNRAISIILATAICGIGIFASGLLPPVAFIGWAILSFIIGFSAPLYQGPVMALMQERIPPEFLGRVFGLIGSVSSLAMLAGLAVVGTFGDIIGVENAFVVSGGIISLLAIALAFIPGVRRIEKESSISK
jgi:DHA3 family macrolide efflux protein-like MFS transporter